MAQKRSKTTTDHDTIRRWVEERGGEPAEVASTGGDGETGIIRVDFPGFSGEGSLRRIPWDEWFRKFDDSGLAFVYQDETAGGARSSFNKLVARETAAAPSRARTSRRRTGSASRARGRTAGSAARSRKSSRAGASARGTKARRGSTTARKGARTAARKSARTTSGRPTTRRRQATRAEAARTASTRSRGAAKGKARTGRRPTAGTGRRTSRRSR